MEEIWKTIPDVEGYEVSSLGRVRSYRSNGGIRSKYPKLLHPYVEYRPSRLNVRVMLRVNGKNKIFLVHRLVMLSFVGPCPLGLEVCHGNGSTLDNEFSNLRYDTRESNILDIYKHYGGLHPTTIQYKINVAKGLGMTETNARVSTLVGYMKKVYNIVASNPDCDQGVIQTELHSTRHHVNNVLRQLLNLKVVSREKRDGLYRYRALSE